MFIIFAFSILIGVSSAIAALICGIIIRNPSYIRMNVFFTRSHLYDFWEDITYLFEIMAFVFIGVLLNIDRLPHFILLGIVISFIVLSSRILSVFLTTLPLDIKSATAHILTNKERLFIGISGFKGLTTAILASYAFVNLESANEPLAEVILYSSLIVILVTGTFQGLIMRPSAKRTEVMEELDELDELKARKLAIEVELDKLVYDRSKERIKPADFRTLSFPLRDELYLIDERMRTLIAEEHAEKEFLEYRMELISEALSSLEKAFEQDEIAEVAFKKIQSKYVEDLEELNFKLQTLAPIESASETLMSLEETKDLDLILAQDTVDSLSQNPNIAKKAPEILQIQKMIKRVAKKLGRKKSAKKKSTINSNSALPSAKVSGEVKTEKSI
jgi:NhaP-type Na+/H+ or K+/H+ antiporter